MTLATARPDEAVRDEDLRRRLEEARGSFGHEFILRQCVSEQQERDRLTQLPRDTPRRDPSVSRKAGE